MRNLNPPLLLENARVVQDNATSHVSRATLQLFQEKNITFIKQPPYSPDCNLNDRYIFPRLEAVRKGNFEDRDQVIQFLSDELPKFSAERMKKALENMTEDLKKIVQLNGEYL